MYFIHAYQYTRGDATHAEGMYDPRPTEAANKRMTTLATTTMHMKTITAMSCNNAGTCYVQRQMHNFASKTTTLQLQMFNKCTNNRKHVVMSEKHGHIS